MPLRPYRDRGNSAAMRQAPGGGRRSAPLLSRQHQSCGMRPRHEYADRADLIGTARVRLTEIARDGKRIVELLALDNVEAEQLLLGLGERPVDHQRRLALAQRSRGR